MAYVDLAPLHMSGASFKSLPPLATAALSRSGRLTLRFVVTPSAAASGYSANVRVFEKSDDATTYAEMDKTTRVLTIVINGTSEACAVALGWSASQAIEWMIEVGGGVATRVRYRLQTSGVWGVAFDPKGGAAGTAHTAIAATGYIRMFPGAGSVAASSDYIHTAPAWSLQALPSDVSSVKMWLRADGGVTLNSTTVSAWANQCALGGSVSQGTGANQPTFSATAGPSGGAALDFDGTSEVMTGSAISNYLSTTAFEIHALVKWDTLPAGAAYTTSPVIAGDASGFVDLAASASGLYQGAHDGGFKSALAAGIATGAWTRVRGRLATSVLGASYNGGAETTQSGFGTVTSLANALIIGARSTYFLDGKIADVILANASFSAGELASIVSYFAARGVA